MIRLGDVVLSDEIATARFACDISRCKGACCVIGDAGAPVSKKEIPILNKAYRQLKERLSEEAVQRVERDGVVTGDSENGYEISCVDSGECIFVERNGNGAATCAIQNAYYRGEIGWEKPISCHLYPIRLKKIAGMEYANFEYIPELCGAGCDRGNREGVWLSDFLEKALVRRYGRDWYNQFLETCNEVRSEKELA
ncbi:MAG: DUF3109 family protein [Balneolaceae bacterium]|nr:DUF3109 family protein [Balneolaceae bacterium]MCH8547238.1 DUF3109 family protein [Balneolaceae bacterium]